MALLDTPTKAQLIDSAAEHINTLVFLKIDTHDVVNGRISEICAIAVHMNELKRTNSDVPRIVDKLCLCVNPVSKFNQHLSLLTGLDNSAVAHKQKLNNNVMEILIQFLFRQSGPVCLVSHNGFRLDFPILSHELDCLKHSMDKLHDKELLCCDSLWTFKEMDNKALGDSNKTARKLGVSILDMIYYTQPSLVHRFLNKSMPQCLTAEEKVTYLLELVCHTEISFFENICCKKLAQVKPTVSASRPVLSSLSNGNHLLVDQTLSINTFVFFDLETTGLRNAKITEISLIAVHASCLLSTKKDDLPRVQDKLSLVFNPEGVIEKVACALSNLNNAVIEESQKPGFNGEAVVTIAQFLQQQAEPICLVAHNGNRFDFPILLQHLGKHKKRFPIFSTAYCSDSLPAMRTTLEKTKPCKGKKRSRATEKPSFKLESVYRRLFPKLKHTFHHAEADTEALVRICCATPGLLNELDQQKRPL